MTSRGENRGHEKINEHFDDSVRSNGPSSFWWSPTDGSFSSAWIHVYWLARRIDMVVQCMLFVLPAQDQECRSERAERAARSRSIRK